VSEGITDGSPKGSNTYKPLDPVNRGAMASFMYRIAGSPDFTPPETSPFTDVPKTNIHYIAICWLKEVGLTIGSPAGSKTYRPSDKVNRGSMATFLNRLAVELRVETAPIDDKDKGLDGVDYNNPVVKAAYKYVGKVGMICDELVWAALIDLGYPHKTITFKPGYGPDADKERTREYVDVYEMTYEISKDKILPGDIILSPGHIEIYAGGGYSVHGGYTVNGVYYNVVLAESTLKNATSVLRLK
jgi:hypothetical protein